jgi:hypothetical protein
LRLSREGFSVRPDGELAERIAWRRRSAQHQYVGRLQALSDRLRLVGREPESGIDVALSIPFREIETIRASGRAAERVFGEPGIVVELVESEPIFLRELGSPRAPGLLARELVRAVAA